MGEEAAVFTERNSFGEKGDVNRVIDELVRQNNRMAIIQQIAKSINVEMSYEEIIDEVSGPLKSVLPYELLSFCLIEKGKLIIKSSIPKEQKILGVGWVLDDHNSAPWKAIKEKRYFYRPDIWNDRHKYREDDDLRTVGIKSAIMAPLFVKNEVIGTLNFGSKETDAYSEHDFIFVQQLADQLAVCIHNTRLFGEVLKSKREWEETFKAVPDRIFLIDRQFNVLRSNVNKAIDEDNGERKCFKVFACCGSDCSCCPAIEAFKTNASCTREVTHSTTRCIYNISAYPVYNEKNEVNSMVVYVSDITAKRRMEAQLFQSAKLAAIGEMAAGVAHELNSPLTAIIGNADLILRKTSPEEKHYRLLQDIKNCGQRSKRIIQNLLTFSRQDSYAFMPISVNDVVLSSLSLVSYQIEKNKIKIIKNLSPGLPPVMGNKQQLEQVIINFLLNAKDATEGSERGIIEVSTELAEEAEYGGFAIKIKVADNGQGIPDNIIGQIFNPFFTTKEKSKGTGLGLSVSLGIAETHGGKIEVWSEYGKGSIFTLVLPIQRV